MTFDELLPTVQALSRSEKWRLMQYLADDLVKQEKELEAALVVGSAHLDASAAAKLMELVDQRKQEVTP